MKNTLSDVHNHLMAQMERLSDEDLSSDPEKLDAEIRRSKSMAQLAGTMVNNARLIVDAARYLDDRNGQTPLPKLITGESAGKTASVTDG